jgi:hypothetical protein
MTELLLKKLVNSALSQRDADFLPVFPAADEIDPRPSRQCINSGLFNA